MRTKSFSLLLLGPLSLGFFSVCSQAYALSLSPRQWTLLSGSGPPLAPVFTNAKQLCEPASGRSGILMPRARSTLRVNEPFEFFLCSPTFFKSSSYEASVVLFPEMRSGGEDEVERDVFNDEEDLGGGLPRVGQVLARNLTPSEYRSNISIPRSAHRQGGQGAKKYMLSVFEQQNGYLGSGEPMQFQIFSIPVFLEG